MQTQTRPKVMSAQPLHKYVFLGVGVWLLFVLTFATACYRVSLSQQFNGMPFKTLADTGTHKPASSY